MNAVKSPPTSPSLTHKQLGMLVAIASMGMLFGTLFLSYLLTRIRYGTWPPIGAEPLNPLLPGISTAVIVASSLVLHSALTALREKQNVVFRKRWGIATLLGATFAVLQVVVLADLYRLGIKVNSDIFSSMVYLFIGFHGAHILAGLGWLFYIFNKATRYTEQRWEGPRLCAWFWHFLDVVWVIMFGMLIWT